MSKNLTVRAWKDAAFRASLSDAERAKILSNPAGERELDPKASRGPAKHGELPTLTRMDTLTVWCCD